MVHVKGGDQTFNSHAQAFLHGRMLISQGPTLRRQELPADDLACNEQPGPWACTTRRATQSSARHERSHPAAETSRLPSNRQKL